MQKNFHVECYKCAVCFEIFFLLLFLFVIDVLKLFGVIGCFNIKIEDGLWYFRIAGFCCRTKKDVDVTHCTTYFSVKHAMENVYSNRPNYKWNIRLHAMILLNSGSPWSKLSSISNAKKKTNGGCVGVDNLFIFLFSACLFTRLFLSQLLMILANISGFHC